jgi:hypothetical protein
VKQGGRSILMRNHSGLAIRVWTSFYEELSTRRERRENRYIALWRSFEAQQTELRHILNPVRGMVSDT